MYKLIHMYAASRQDADDLYQEIMYQAWKSWHTYRGDAKISTWLYRLCLNTILSQQRKVNKVSYTDAWEQLATDTAFMQHPNDNVASLYAAIRTLKETDRAIISLHLDGYDNGEIAEIIGIKYNYVGVKLSRIKEELFNLLKPAK